MHKLIDKLKDERTLRYLPYFIIGIGMLMRLLVYLQNNSMFIDEANIARNIFERGYARLAQPLSYEQYAPPIFLWIVKTTTNFGGYSEYAYRIYPLLCGIGSLWLMYAVLRRYTNHTALWYGLLLMSTGYIYISYANVTKQYVPDMLICLWLVWLALDNEIQHKKAGRLFLIWALAGSLAIWSSMPSVFILAGVGLYYFIAAIQTKTWKRLWFIFAAAIVWVAQFIFYYLAILKPQINSTYLFNCHKEYFFYDPVSRAVLDHNIELASNFLATPGGHQTIAIGLHLLCMVIAIVYLLRRQAAKAMLLIVPIAAVLVAASQHQYTLIARVMLFVTPMMLVLVCVGLEKLLNTRFIAVSYFVVLVCLVNFINFNALKYFLAPMQNEEMKLSLRYLQQQHFTGDKIYVHDLAKPAYFYYTGIHPDKFNHTELIGGKTLFWNTNYDSLARSMQGRSAMLYSWEEPWKIAEQQRIINLYNNTVDSNIVMGGRVYIYERKP